MYDRLTKTNAVETEQLDYSPSINSLAAADSPISSVCRQLLELQSAVASINHRFNSTAIATATTDNNQLSGQNASSYIQGTQTQGIPIDTLPPINIISSQLKKTIEERKHVNLALLLIPGMSIDKETHIIDSGGNNIVVKSTDARLTRSLNIEEFRQAFSLYCNIICEKEPLRRAEFDT